MLKSTLASLAIIKVNYERGKDYIDNFVPFVVECARLSTDDIVSLPTLQTQLSLQFGIFIPLNPLKQILHRASRDGYFYTEGGILYKDISKCSQSEFYKLREKITEMENGLIGEFCSFASSHHKKQLTETEGEEYLISFLNDNGMEITYAYAEKSIIPQLKTNTEIDFIVADFINYCQLNNPELFSQIDTVVRGALLCNSLYIPDQSKINMRFKNTSVYLDSAFTIYLLGYAGEIRKTPCIELIKLLIENGANIRVFSHTVDEVHNILDACAAKIRRNELRDAYGPSMEYFITQKIKSTDIDLYIARLEINLKNMGIKIEDKPKYTPSYNIDEKSMDNHLEKAIRYINPKAREHDVDAIAAIARLRRGKHSHHIENCGALFITTNSDLAKATREFFTPELPSGSTTLCITDYALGNLLWLKNPTQSPNLPKKYLSADVYAAMQPSDDLWKKYLTEIALLEKSGSISSDDYMLLRHHHVSRNTLMELTKGNTQSVTEGTITELLEISKLNIRKDILTELENERKRNQDLSNRIQQSIDQTESRRIKKTILLQKISTYISKTVFGIIYLLFFVGSIYSFPWELPSVELYWHNYILSISQFIILVYTLISSKNGRTLNDFQDKFILIVYKYLDKIFTKINFE